MNILTFIHLYFVEGSYNLYGEYYGADSICVNHGSMWSLRACNRLIQPKHSGSGCYRVGFLNLLSVHLLFSNCINEISHEFLKYLEMIYLVPRKYSYSLMHRIMQCNVHVVKMTFAKEILLTQIKVRVCV